MDTQGPCIACHSLQDHFQASEFGIKSLASRGQAVGGGENVLFLVLKALRADVLTTNIFRMAFAKYRGTGQARLVNMGTAKLSPLPGLCRTLRPHHDSTIRHRDSLAPLSFPPSFMFCSCILIPLV